MSETQASASPAGTVPMLQESEVASYLLQHPDFFDRHPSLLTELRVPHPSGRAVSLVERQLEALRSKANRYKGQIDSLVSVARENDLLNRRLHHLTLALIDAADFTEVLNILEDRLHEEFRADAVELRLFSSSRTDVLSDAAETAAVDPEQAAFLDFFRRAQPVCGSLSRQQLEYLYGLQADDIASTALLPLQGEGIMGVLAIGSQDAQRFSPEMGTDFLVRLAEIVSRKLQVVSLPGV
jgi:uncharacterized protein YigA (DUF484 family)